MKLPTLISLTILLLTTLNQTLSQLPDCYFQDLNLSPCLTNGIQNLGNMSEICCTAINQALSTGQDCLCSILYTTNLFLDMINPIPTSLSDVELPGCRITPPSLSVCQAVITIPPPAIDAFNSTALPAPTDIGPIPSTSSDSQLVPNNDTSSDNQLLPDNATSPGSQFVPNNETESEPVRNRQHPFNVVSQVDQHGGSNLREMDMMHHMVCISLAFLLAVTDLGNIL